MEETNYVFDAKSYVMGARGKQGPVIKIEDEFLNNRLQNGNSVQKKTMQDRANNLLSGSKSQVSKGAVEVIRNRNYAQEQTLKNNYYRFIMQVSGFANEPMQKLWNQNFKKDEKPLLSEGLSLPPRINNPLNVDYSSMDNVRDSDRQATIEKELIAKGNILKSAEVSGQLFLSPSAYSHLLESWEIIRHRCNTNVSLDTLVSVEHSTYFARLVALRIQLSRFLSGRYYSVASNYKRLLKQQESLIRGYFKAKFNSGGCRTISSHPSQQYLHALQEL